MKYIEIYQDIKGKILKGIYMPWAPLQGEEFLCDYYGISRTTVRKALAKLKQDGFIHTRQGSGIFVNPPEFYEEQHLTTLSERIDKSEELENQILFYETIEADEDISSIFNLPKGSGMYHYKRIRKINGIPKVLEETYMPCYLFKDFSEETLKGSMLKYIEKNCNYIISHDIKNITAVNIDSNLADLLNIPIGSSTLQINHKVYLIKSILAQYTKEIQTNASIRIVSVR